MCRTQTTHESHAVSKNATNPAYQRTALRFVSGFRRNQIPTLMAAKGTLHIIQLTAAKSRAIAGLDSVGSRPSSRSCFAYSYLHFPCSNSLGTTDHVSAVSRQVIAARVATMGTTSFLCSFVGIRSPSFRMHGSRPSRDRPATTRVSGCTSALPPTEPPTFQTDFHPRAATGRLQQYVVSVCFRSIPRLLSNIPRLS